MPAKWSNKWFDRTERTVGVADPTVVVTNRIYGTNPDKTIMVDCYCETIEMQGVVQGIFVYKGQKSSDLTEHVANLTHKMVEDAYELWLSDQEPELNIRAY